MKIAIVAITRNGVALGMSLQSGLAGARLHAPVKYAALAGPDTDRFELPLREEVRRLWPMVGGFVFIMAAGIVVRLVAPLLERKDRDPAVVVMDDTGRFAVSLLSGHLGGANELAARCAFITGGRDVITTATDANGLPSFDMLAREEGWEIEDLSRVKVLNSLLLDGEEIAVVDGTDRVRLWFHGRGKLRFHESFTAGLRSRAAGFLVVTNALLPPQLQSGNLLVLRPKNLVLGIGCNRGTVREEIEAVAAEELQRLSLSPKSISCIATAEAKRDEPGLVSFAEKLGVPLRWYGSSELNSVAAPSSPSAHAVAAIGARGVAEPAALLASAGGNLILEKIKRGNVTLAIAERLP